LKIKVFIRFICGFPSDMTDDFALILSSVLHTLCQLLKRRARCSSGFAYGFIGEPGNGGRMDRIKTMKHPCTGVILAGGLNTRFSGKEKAFLDIKGTRILDRILDTFKAVFNEIILVTNHPVQYLEWNVHIVTDLLHKRSAMTGIHTGLYFSTYSHIFVSASDTPFLKRSLIETIVEKIEPAIDVIIPETSAGLEPLCAVYSKKRLPVIEKLLAEDRFKIQQLFTGARVKRVPQSCLQASDPTLLSFFNINTPQDLQRALEIEKREL